MIAMSMDGREKKETMMPSNIKSSMKTKIELEVFYEELLKDEFVGYIQMSDSIFKKEHLLIDKKTLPEWGALHNEVNYILEMALYSNDDIKRSILVRQYNAQWLILEGTLSGNENMDSYFIVTDKDNKKKMKIAQIWNEESSGFCLGMDVLEPKYLMFAGFTDAKEVSHDNCTV